MRQGAMSGAGQYIEPHTSVVIPVHAGIANRILTLVATRINADPEIPAPSKVLDSYNGLTESLLSQTLVAQSVELQSDGVTPLHGIKIEYVYGLNRPLGSTGMSDYYRRPSSPKDLSTPELAQLDPGAIETSGKIELG